MDPGVIAVCIPIVAIGGAYITKCYQITMEHQSTRARPDSSVLENRVKQLEDRVTTLQDIVISGDYEVQRRLKEKEAELHRTAMPMPERQEQSVPVTGTYPFQTNREG